MPANIPDQPKEIANHINQGGERCRGMYRVVVDATRNGAPFGHWEQSVTVVVSS